jgi:hypothetical protein
MVITLLVEATIPSLAKKRGKRRGVQGIYKAFSGEAYRKISSL